MQIKEAKSEKTSTPPHKSLSRRDFLKLMGASSFMAIAACRRPVEQIVPAVSQAPESQPGIPNFYSSVTPDGAGLIVRTRDARPVKLAGNPEHPLSLGSLSAFQTASLMDLYDPDRLRRSAVIRAKTGKRVYRDDKAIVPLAQSKLEKGSYVLLTAPVQSPSTRRLIQAFLKKYPGGKHMEFRPDPSFRQIAEGQEVSYGKELLPLYRFDRADIVLSIDEDFLGYSPLSYLYTPAFFKKRELRKKNKRMSRLLVFESMMSVTGSNADERFSIRPGDQTLIALSLASQIVLGMGKSTFTSDAKVKRLLKPYLPSNIASTFKHKEGLYQAGNFERIMIRLATELWENKGRSLVIGASPLTATGNNANTQIAINLLNSILENDGKTIDYKQNLTLSPGAKDREWQRLIADIQGTKVKTLIVADANLAYHLPPKLKIKETLKAGKQYILSLNDRIDEIGQFADAILPTSHYLESWGDSQIIENLLSIQQPVIRPLHQTLSFEDRLIQLAGGEIEGKKSFYDFLQEEWKKYMNTTRFRAEWVRALQNGFYAKTKNIFYRSTSPKRSFQSNSIDRLPRFSKEIWDKVAENKLYIGMYYNVQVRDGSRANNAYRQELPEPITKLVWDNALSLLPETARSLGLKQGTLVKVKIDDDKTLEIPVHLQPGLHPQGGLLTLGYGREKAGKVANGVGKNVVNLMEIGSDSFIFSGTLAHIEKTSKSYELATTQAIYRNGQNQEEKAPFTPQGLHEVPYRGSSQHGRPIARETNFEDFKSGKFELKPEGVEYPKKQRLTEPWDYKETRWHMFIDLNACTGCGACVTSCNTENNIPMVGKDEVKVGREMHWLRIDRYFDGKEEEASVSHQPMLCQHCEDAPCENVCPVAATTHNSEGLNVMTYNRCIGTRYCANNCPYKVRRFNWFENWHYWEGGKEKISSPQHLALNPDVTVRSRGVMEKCTFCVQRIASHRQDKKVNKAKGKELNPQDKSLQTACQEVCPTQAISFGNILDPDSEVAKLKKEEKRQYKVLDFLGIKPQVSYLAKVRNRKKNEETEKS